MLALIAVADGMGSKIGRNFTGTTGESGNGEGRGAAAAVAEACEVSHMFYHRGITCFPRRWGPIMRNDAKRGWLHVHKMQWGGRP